QKWELPAIKQEHQELEAMLKKIQHNRNALRSAALGDLVNNILILDYTRDLRRNQAIKASIEPDNNQVHETLEKLRAHYSNYLILSRREHSLTVELMEGLRIFKRREMLNVYFIQHKQEPLQNWIKSRFEVAKAKDQLH